MPTELRRNHIALKWRTCEKLEIKHHFGYSNDWCQVHLFDLAQALYLKGFEVETFPTSFGLSVMRKNLEKQVLLFEESCRSELSTSS